MQVSTLSGGTVVYKMLSGTATNLQDCTVVDSTTARLGKNSVELRRSFLCQPNQFHDVKDATANVTDLFELNATSSSIRWSTTVTSSSTRPWSTAIRASLGYADGGAASRIWLGGPRSGNLPSASDDPYAPFSLSAPPATAFTSPYGGLSNDIGRKNRPANAIGPSSTLPMLTLIGKHAGLSLLHSPEDTPVVASASAARVDRSDGLWQNWTRYYHRLGAGVSAVRFESDLLAHAPCWRPAAAWLRSRYPRFFEPHPAAASALRRLSGLSASYADLRGPADLDAQAASEYKRMGWGLNWDSSARFPWHGEWAPTAADGFDTGAHHGWLTCFAHDAPDSHTGEGCKNVTYGDLSSWYAHIRRMGEEVGARFSSCQYGNLFEFGWNVRSVWPAKPLNCTALSVAASNATRLLCHTQGLLRDREYGKALLFSPADPSPSSGSLVCGGMEGSCLMDPSPDLPYLPHLLAMARASIAHAPSDGVCIDRQDWVGEVNPNADDGKTWLPVAPVTGVKVAGLAKGAGRATSVAERHARRVGRGARCRRQPLG